MKAKQLATLVATVFFATAAYAGEQAHHKMEIKVIADDGDGQTQFVLDSDDLDFNLHDMQVGENQSIVDKDGRSILITRGEDGFTFDVDGKTIEMPVFGGHDDGYVWVAGGDHTGDFDVDVRVVHDGMAPRAMGMDGVMIISEKEIDEATQQVIRTALESAGHEGVHFAGGHEGGLHQVKVIRKLVEVSE